MDSDVLAKIDENWLLGSWQNIISYCVPPWARCCRP